MSEKPMRLKELAAKFDGEWVLLRDPLKHKRTGQVLGGIVVAHGPDRDDVYDAGLTVPPPRHLAVLCFKLVPAGHLLVL